jgi:tRNA nucleotidyltransferase (CCA-adding enzyme)
VLALACNNLVGAMFGNKPINSFASLIGRYLNPDDLVAHPVPLLSGKEIILALNIPPSPLIGQLLMEIAIAQVEQRVSTPAEAIALARQLLEEGNGE